MTEMFVETDKTETDKKKKEKKIIKPPYIPVGWIERFFAKITQVKVNKIDNSFINNYGITQSGNESKVVACLKFLKIIDENGLVDQTAVQGLRMEGEEYENKLRELVENAYEKLFKEVDLEKCDSATLRNYFISQDMTQTMAKGAVTLFVFLCNKADIKLSKEINDKNATLKNSNETKREKIITRKTKIKTKTRETEKKQEPKKEIHYHFHFDKDTPPENVERVMKNLEQKKDDLSE